MGTNGDQHPPRPRIEIAQAAASPEEAAAIAAALEQFLRDTAPAPVAASTAVNPWLRAGLFENAGHRRPVAVGRRRRLGALARRYRKVPTNQTSRPAKPAQVVASAADARGIPPNRKAGSQCARG